MSDVRTDRCPLCGQDNACRLSAAAGDPAAWEGCWCRTAAIPDAVLAQIPTAARDRACICRGCAAGEAPAAGVTLTRDPGGRAAVELTRGDDRVVIARTGAQVLSWRRGDEDALWTASDPAYADGAAVRGGVPVVFPWFGDHSEDPEKPAHGFARSCEWRVVDVAPAAVTFALGDDEQTRALWPRAFHLELEVALDDALHIKMRVFNPSGEPLCFEQALHTYFAVGDVRSASVHGLEDVPVTEHARAPEADWDPSAPVRFRAETDRVFQGAPDRMTLQAPALGRQVDLQTSDARSTIVWNPWPAKTARLSQMAPDDWQTFCCVETANCKENTVTLAPGARHEMALTLRRSQRAPS